MDQKISLMIVDDHQLFRECLASVLTQENFTVVELVADTRDVLNKIKVHKPDIVLISIDLSNSSTFELTKQISLELSRTKVIIFGLTESESTILECIEVGAKGYTLKETTLCDLMTVIRLVYRGETVCSPQIAYSIFSRVAELACKRHDRQILEFGNLTLRETNILELIAHGLSNKQIAKQLYLSPYTVKNHVHSILEKLQAHNRQEATHCALREGLLGKTAR